MNTNKLYFRVKVGYGHNEYIPIEGKKELEKAIWAFSTNDKAVFDKGLVRGQDIIAITEDWHREMGWNPTHIIEGEDWQEIKEKGVQKKYENLISSVKSKVGYLIETNQENLIGTDYEMPMIGENKKVSQGIEDLAERMRIK